MNINDPVTISIIGIGLCIFAILVYLDVISIGKTRKVNEHKSPVRYRTKLYHPEYGELTIVKGKKVGDATVPYSMELGKDNPLPFTIKPYETDFPLNPIKNFFGDPAGRTWLHVTDNYPFEKVRNIMSDGYKRRDEVLLFENHYLANDNQKLRSQVDEKVRQMAELIGDVRKQTATYINPDMLKHGNRRGDLGEN